MFWYFYQTRGKIDFVHLCTAKEEVYASLRFSGAATLLYNRSCYKCNTKQILHLLVQFQQYGINRSCSLTILGKTPQSVEILINRGVCIETARFGNVPYLEVNWIIISPEYALSRVIHRIHSEVIILETLTGYEGEDHRKC